MKPGFVATSALQTTIAGLRKHIEALESGSAFQTLKNQLNAANRTIDSLKKQLQAETLRHDKELEKTTTHWLEAMEDVRQEAAKQIAQKDKELEKMQQKLERAIAEKQEATQARQEALVAMNQERVAHQDTKDKLEALQARLKKDYTNSSKSSGDSHNHPPIPNNRKKTGRKPGAQVGHDVHPRKRMTPSRVEKVPPLPEFLDTSKYKPTGHSTVKQLIRVSLTVEAVDYVADEYRNLQTGARVHSPFPFDLKDDVTYDPSVKAAAFLLNHHCHASIDKTIDFLSQLSDGQLQLSKGFVNNLSGEFAQKTQKERDEIFLTLANADVLHTDFTFSRCAGKTAVVSVCCTDNAVMYQARDHKGYEGIKDTPAAVNPNTIVSDHEAVLTKLGSRHQECGNCYDFGQ